MDIKGRLKNLGGSPPPGRADLPLAYLPRRRGEEDPKILLGFRVFRHAVKFGMLRMGNDRHGSGSIWGLRSPRCFQVSERLNPVV